MAFPQIHQCLICEDVRLEHRRLTTIVGFYGATPNVEILTKEFGTPFPRLAFLLLADRGAGHFKVSVQIRDENGNVIMKGPQMDLEINDSTRRNNWAFGFGAPIFPHAGRYDFILEVDGQKHYQTTFEVLQGKPEDFV